MIISNIKQFLAKNKKIFYYLGFFLVVFSMSSDVTFAAEGDIKAGTYLEWFLKFVAVILTLFTYLSTIFLSPSWINGSIFGLNGYFKDIWILVSNIVYFVFAFILIWIAFMNIIGKSGDQYQLKQALPKFIVGVLIVPFSWFLVQFILSISAILTVSAITLPFDTFDEYRTGLNGVNIPMECQINVKSFSTGSIDQTFSCTEGKVILLEKLMVGSNATNSIFGILSMYTYGILSLDRIDDIKLVDLKEIKTFFDLGVSLLFDVLFVIVYFILIVTLGIVLLIRGIYIWIYIMLSPLFGLMYFFDKKDGGDGFFAKFNLKEFIALAMVPVYTMLALSFGLLFIYVIGAGMSSNTGGISNDAFKIQNNIIKIGSGEETFNLEIKGSVSKIDNVTGFLTGFGNGALGIVGSLIMKVFGIVILWGTIMAAMRTSEITKAITEPIHSFGTKVGGIMTSAPGNIPIFGGMSAKGLDQGAGMVKTHYDNKSIRTGSDFINKHTRFGSETTGAKELANEIRTGTLLKSEVGKFREIIAGQTPTNIANDANLIDALKAMGEKLQIPEDVLKGIKSGDKDGVAKALFEIHNSETLSQLDTNRLYGSNKITNSTSEFILSKNQDLKSDPISSRKANNEIRAEYKSDSGDNRIYTVDGARIEVINNNGKQSITLSSSIEKLAKLIQGGMTQEDFVNNILSNMEITDDNEITTTFNSIASKLYKNSEGKLSLVKLDGYSEITRGIDIWTK